MTYRTKLPIYNEPCNLIRRKLITGLAASIALPNNLLFANSSVASIDGLTRKQIPGTSDTLPCIGMGTWLTFDVPASGSIRDDRANVMDAFFQLGGGMIDSSPMYGHAEDVIGYCLSKIEQQKKDNLFSASKIWTPIGRMGKSQMSSTESLWGVKPIDLMQVHNLVAWKKHLPNLRRWKDEGRIRYVGVTTSHGRRHKEMESLLKSEPVDFLQLTYNIEQIQAADRLLPLAQDLGIAVVINRPFERGKLFSLYARRALPGIAVELGCKNWAQFLLLYIVSHPAVTCAIPATTRVDHMQENMGTMLLPLPDQATRLKMRQAVI